jgi:hypothetical protein
MCGLPRWAESIFSPSSPAGLAWRLDYENSGDPPPSNGADWGFRERNWRRGGGQHFNLEGGGGGVTRKGSDTDGGGGGGGRGRNVT